MPRAPREPSDAREFLSTHADPVAARTSERERSEENTRAEEHQDEQTAAR